MNSTYQNGQWNVIFELPDLPSGTTLAFAVWNGSQKDQTGKVKLTVVSKTGKEATIGILSGGDFFGEGSLAGQALRMGSATAMTDCAVLRIEKKAIMEALHREHEVSDMFVAYLLARNIRYEEDFVDQLFNSSEKRLGRVLLLLAHFGKEGKSESVVPKISQEMLAEMIGTTRSRVSLFMNRFRELGFIHYNGGLQVHSSLLHVVVELRSGFLVVVASSGGIMGVNARQECKLPIARSPEPSWSARGCRWCQSP